MKSKKIQFFNKSKFQVDPNSGVGNYFRPRAILLFYKCLAGHISVKKAQSKLKNSLCGPDVARGPYVASSGPNCYSISSYPNTA